MFCHFSASIHAERKHTRTLLTKRQVFAKKKIEMNESEASSFSECSVYRTWNFDSILLLYYGYVTQCAAAAHGIQNACPK